MADRSCDFPFVVKPETIRFEVERASRQLQRDMRIAPDVFSFVDVAHAAASEQADDAVAAEGVAGDEPARRPAPAGVGSYGRRLEG